MKRDYLLVKDRTDSDINTIQDGFNRISAEGWILDRIEQIDDYEEMSSYFLFIFYKDLSVPINEKDKFILPEE